MEVVNTSDGLEKAIISQKIGKVVKIAKERLETDLEKHRAEAELLTSKFPEELPEDSLEDYISAFEEGFLKLGLTEYNLEIVYSDGFNFRPKPKDKKIIMNKNANMQFFGADGEARHELAHIVRYENGMFNDIPRSENYLPTEEGLATYVHDLSEFSEASKYQHACEYLAASIALESSLREVYDFFIEKGFEQELVWQRASRHKFGIKDTSKPGGIIKPAMYFAKCMEIVELIVDERVRLFVGKIEIEELPKYLDYSGKIEEGRLRDYFLI